MSGGILGSTILTLGLWFLIVRADTLIPSKFIMYKLPGHTPVYALLFTSTAQYHGRIFWD